MTTPTIAQALAGSGGSIAMAMRYELRDRYNRFQKDITSAVRNSGSFEVDIFRDVPSRIQGLTLDAAMLGDVDFDQRYLAPFVQLGMPSMEIQTQSIRTSPTYASLIMDLDPVAYWRMNDNAGANLTVHDFSGNSLHGTATGTGGETFEYPTLLADTTVDGGRAIDFESGSNGSYTVTHNSVLNVGDVFSITFLMKAESLTGNHNIISKGNNNFNIIVSSNGALTLQKKNVGVVTQTPAGAIVTGTTYHIVITKNGVSTAAIYINGVAANGSVSADVIASTSDDLIVGDAPFLTNYDGVLQEMAIYATELTAQQAADLYAASIATPEFESSVVRKASTIEWQLGLFVLGRPTRRLEESSGTWSIDAGDMCERLASFRLDKAYHTRTNQNIYNAVSFLADGAGLRVIMEGAEQRTAEAYTWAPGTSYLKVMNDLALSAGCYPFWSDRDGVIHTRRVDVNVQTTDARTFEEGSPGGDEFFGSAQPYANATVNWIGPDAIAEYRMDREPRLLRSPLSGSISPEDKANVVIAEGISMTHVVVGNVDRRSHLHPTQVGRRTHERVLDLQLSAQTEVLLDHAGWQLILAEAFSENYDIQTNVDPRPEGRPYYRIAIDGFSNDEVWMSMGWRFNLSLGEGMVHRIGHLIRDLEMAAYTVTEFSTGIPFTEPAT